MAFDLKTLEKVLALAKKHKLAEVELEDGKNKIKIKTALGVQPILSGGVAVGASGAASAASQMMPMSERPLPLEESPKNLSAMDEGRYSKVMSPFVGTFYRAASPDADPYAKEGQMIKKGDVLCIVEAMKLMNEIESEVSGKIISVLVENGQPVEYGEPLFLIDPV